MVTLNIIRHSLAAAVGCLCITALSSSRCFAFSLYDATLFTDKPTPISEKIPPIRLVYESEICPRSVEFPTGRCEDANGVSKAPKKERVQEVVRSAAKQGFPYVVLDIECWPLQELPFGPSDKPQPCHWHPATTTEIEQSIRLYTDVLRWANEVKEQSKVGYYAVTPPHLGAYWATIRGNGDLANWLRAVERASPIANEADFISPSLYTFFDRRPEWVTSAKRMIYYARKAYPGKPIIPFIWPQYHESASILLRGSFLPADYWRIQLYTLKTEVDGAFIWGGHKKTWDARAEWWQQTLDFLDKP